MKNFILDKSNLKLLIYYFGLSLVSIISIFLAELNNGITPTLFLKQIIFITIGLLIIFIMQKITIQTYEKMTIAFFIFTLCLLVAVLIAPDSIAPEANGAKAWFNFIFFTIQPSEFAKVATVGIISFLIIQSHFNKASDFMKLLGLALIISMPFILIMKENDLGNGLFFIFLFLALTFLVSSRNKTFFTIYSIVVGILALIILSAIYFPNLVGILGFKSYQLKRILSWLYPENYKYDFAYQITNALNEIKIGGLTGSFEKNKVFIDEQFNDFIFSVIAKNFGFIGATIFIIFYFIFILKIMSIAKKCEPGNFSYYFSILTAFSFALPFIINSYSATGIIPVIGISMPFISYGGSSLIANSILLGVIFKINKTIDEEYLEDEEEYRNSEYELR